jgi:hypothetical protein
MTGEIIIADTITAKFVMTGIYDVTASVMGASDSRYQAKTVTIRWNTNAGSTSCKDLLIAAYQNIISPPEASIIAQLMTDIGTVVPA